MVNAQELRDRIDKLAQKAEELLQQGNRDDARTYQEQVRILQKQLDDLTGAADLPSSASAGARPPQLRSLWVKSPSSNAIQIPVTNGRIDVSGTGMSAAPKLGSYWAYYLPVATVEMHAGDRECLDLARVDDEGFVLLDMEKLGQLGQREDNAIILKFGYHTGWSNNPFISAWWQHPALQQKKVS